MSDVQLYNSATEFVASAITLQRGVVSDIVSVGMYLNVTPTVIPTVGQFTTVLLKDGTATPPLDPLAVPGIIDILAKIGPGGGAVTAGHFPTLTPGDYQCWTLVTTASEHAIRRPGVITIT